MADDGQNKTEAPTERRRHDARERGQIAYSTELTSGIYLCMAVLVFWLLGQSIAMSLLQLVRGELLTLEFRDWGIVQTIMLARISARWLLGPSAAIMFITWLATLIAGGLQSGFRLSSRPLVPDVSRLSPTKGWDRTFSMRTAMRTGLVVFKLLAVAVLIVWVAWSWRRQLIGAALGSLTQVTVVSWSVVVRSSAAVSVAMLVFGLVDYMFQHWRHEQDLRMTTREVREERKQEQGDPELRARIRRVQRAIGQRRMMTAVPTASVVVTNPTHLAVALKYEDAMSAPQVVAKGSGTVALRIRQLAEENNVPVLERQPLARALYATAEVGDEVPHDLYRAVAEILAYVYRLTGSL